MSILEALAELLTYVDFRKPLTRVRNYMRHHPPSGKARYSGGVRRASERLTESLGRPLNGKGLDETVKQLWLVAREYQQGPGWGMP